MPTATTEEVTKKAAKIDELVFVKLKIPKLIPRDLIESVKGRTFTPEQFYDYQSKQLTNPYNHLFALVDSDKKIHGYLWAEVNVLDNSLFINTFSISKAFWGKGEAIKKATEFLDEFRKKLNSTRVFWVTTNEKFFAKRGFKRSRNSLMEFCPEAISQQPAA